MKLTNLLAVANLFSAAMALPSPFTSRETEVLEKRVYTSTETDPVTQNTYNLLEKFSRIASISYCVRPPLKIMKPFKCGIPCEYFPDVELLQQFHEPEPFVFDVSGYVAVDHGSKQIYVVARGTKGLEDTITDLRVMQAPFDHFDLGTNNASVTADCKDCLVHKGFIQAYNNTMKQIQPVLDSAVNKYPDYKVAVTGHSLGGATALLLGINLKVNGYDPLVITYGQPLVGNAGFANWVDKLFFGQENPDTTQITADRKFFRVTHKGDIVTQVPFWDGYTHNSGEVFIDWHTLNPPLHKVVACKGQSNKNCSAGNKLVQQVYLKNHVLYFIYQGKCNAFNTFSD
uniref:triacylglycerol lipase n=1 Tax=Yarrowia phangngaensis TaxID=444778 RepID=A0A078BQK6_9ASCO|nr:lipase [Yarrowia phangngaensis]